MQRETQPAEIKPDPRSNAGNDIGQRTRGGRQEEYSKIFMSAAISKSPPNYTLPSLLVNRSLKTCRKIETRSWPMHLS